MISQRERNRRLKGGEFQVDKILWMWIIAGIFLAAAMALMIASDDQPANASLDIWSTEMTVGGKRADVDAGRVSVLWRPRSRNLRRPPALGRTVVPGHERIGTCWCLSAGEVERVGQLDAEGLFQGVSPQG